MSVPPQFADTTARLALPLLFSAQAQKEEFHNEALARLDALVHPVIEKELSEPPLSPEDGQSWLVGPDAAGAWSECSGSIAMRQSGQWLFAAPFAGLRIYDREAQQFAVFFDTWQKPSTIQEPSGGSVVDSEARAAIGAVLSVLRAAGILPSA